MRNRLAALALLASVGLGAAACGGQDHENHRSVAPTGSADGTANGNPLQLALAQGPAGAPAGDPRLANTEWGLASGTEGAGIVFAADARYAALVLRVVGGSTVEAMATVGTYAAQGGTFSVHRVRTTCPDLAGRTSGPEQYRLVDAQTLLLSNGATTAVLKRVQPSTPPAVVITWGCFDSVGSFTPHAWTNL